MRHTTIRKSANQESLLFDELIAKNWARFYHFAKSMCQNNADQAEDLLSESLLDAYRGFRPAHAITFRSWFYKIMSNNRIDMVRQVNRLKTESLDAILSDGKTLELPDPSPSVETLLLQRELSQRLHSALNTLSEDSRLPLLLCDLEGWSYHEIAEHLQLPMGTVRSRIHRGRQKLKRALDAAQVRS